MKVVSKSTANRMVTESLFKAGGTATKVVKYDLGKYQPTPSQLVGREIPDSDRILCVYPKRMRDKDGPYTQLFAIVKE